MRQSLPPRHRHHPIHLPRSPASYLSIYFAYNNTLPLLQPNFTLASALIDSHLVKLTLGAVAGTKPLQGEGKAYSWTASPHRPPEIRYLDAFYIRSIPLILSLSTSTPSVTPTYSYSWYFVAAGKGSSFLLSFFVA